MCGKIDGRLVRFLIGSLSAPLVQLNNAGLVTSSLCVLPFFLLSLLLKELW